MEPHVARHRISRNPNNQVLFTGKYDSEGEPICRASGEKIMPGVVFFPTDEEERVWLLELDSARLLTEQEKAIWEQFPDKIFPVNER